MNPSKKRELEEVDFDEPKKRVPPSRIPGDDLCERCQSIEWAKLCEEPPLSRQGQLVARIASSREELRQSRCRICKLLGLLRPKSSGDETWKLKAFSSRISFAYLKRTTPRGPLPPSDVPECTVLYMIDASTTYNCRRGWHKTGCLLLSDTEELVPDCGPRKILPNKIDYSLIKEWMSGCNHRHQKTCVRPKGPFPGNLRVIDCRTREVIAAPKRCKYVAISYVWGPTPQGSEAHRGFSPVVEDSISVTLSLGFHYLWVDKHCIDQDSPDKQEQIARMDLIYSQAELTIIAAAGASASYGLPGVGTTSRKVPESTGVAEVRLSYVPPHTSHTLLSSTWASRGWTYQESILSRRRIVFTDDQVSWVCNAKHSCESADMPPESLIGIEDNPFQGFVPKTANPMRKRYLELGNLTDYEQIKVHITEYSRRKLTHDSDALNAILSIFESTQAVKRELAGEQRLYTLFYHLHGLPIKLSPRPDSTLLPFGWYHVLPAERRHGFPSWSWTGWKGAVRMDDPDVYTSRHCSIEVLDGETLISLADYLEHSNSPVHESTSLPPMELLITGRAMPIGLVSKVWGDLNESFSQESRADNVTFLDGPHAELRVAEKIWAYIYAHMDCEISLDDELVGIVLGEQTSKKALGILLLRPHEDGYERVGILRYRDGRGTEAGGKHLPHIVYVDEHDKILDELESVEGDPLWLQQARVTTLRVH